MGSEESSTLYQRVTSTPSNGDSIPNERDERFNNTEFVYGNENWSDTAREDSIIYGSDIERGKCILHDDDKMYYCVDCIEFICLKCGQTTHSGHDWNTISNTLKKLELIKMEAGKLKVHNRAKLLENKDILESKRLHLKTKIDTIVDKSEEDYERDITLLYEQKLETLEKDIEKEISCLNIYMSHPDVFNTQAQNGHDLAAKIKYIFDRSNLETLKDTSVLYAAAENQEGKDVRLMVGTIIDFRMTKLIPLEPEFPMRNITQIVALKENLAWVGSRGEKEIKLIDIEGKILKRCKLAFALESFAICKSDQLLVTSTRNMTIQPVDVPRAQNIQLTTHPTFISKAASSDILISSLTDLQNPTGKIFKCTLDTSCNVHEIVIGKVLTCPQRVAENDNGDLCIVNKTSKTSNKTELVIQKKNGPMSVLFEDVDDAVEISDIAFDKFGNIICSESNRNAVSLIFWNGEKFEKISICQRERPIALARHGEYLWSSSENGNIQVHVLQYRRVCVD